MTQQLSPFCRWPGCIRDAAYGGNGLCAGHVHETAGRKAQLLHLRNIERRLAKRLEEIRHEIRVLETQR